MKQIELQGFSAGYGRAAACGPLDLVLHSGEVVVVTSHNGAGKSTLLKGLMGLTPWSRGRLLGDDLALHPLASAQRARRGLGYVPEERRLFGPLTVYENLMVAARPRRLDGTHWDLERVFALFPPLAALRHRVSGRLSGGEQQMLAIARTLMTQPRYLLLDEPLQGLAPRIAQAVGDAVKALQTEGLGLLVVEHDEHFIRQMAHRLYWMERGQLDPLPTWATLQQRRQQAFAHR